MSLREILYVDRLRLERYAMQLRPGLDAKVTSTDYSGEIGVLGPKGSVNRSARYRALSESELIELVTKGSKAATVRPSRTFSSEFVMERCDASRVVVPPGKIDGKEARQLVLWVTRSDEDLAGLCLMEDAEGDDSQMNFYGASVFTLLQALIYETRKRDLTTLLDDYIPDDPHSNIYVDWSNKPEGASQYHNVKRWATAFANDPAQTLTKWGCVASGIRRIEVLYRVRAEGMDDHCGQKPAVFGYPIWIADAR